MSEVFLFAPVGQSRRCRNTNSPHSARYRRKRGPARGLPPSKGGPCRCEQVACFWLCGWLLGWRSLQRLSMPRLTHRLRRPSRTPSATLSPRVRTATGSRKRTRNACTPSGEPLRDTLSAMRYVPPRCASAGPTNGFVVGLYTPREKSVPSARTGYRQCDAGIRRGPEHHHTDPHNDSLHGCSPSPRDPSYFGLIVCSGEDHGIINAGI